MDLFERRSSLTSSSVGVLSEQALQGSAAHAGGAQGRRRLYHRGRRTRRTGNALLSMRRAPGWSRQSAPPTFSFESICTSSTSTRTICAGVCANGGRPAGATGVASARLREGEAAARSHAEPRAQGDGAANGDGGVW